MPLKHFWSCVDSLAATIDGGREASEQALDDLEADLRAFDARLRDERRRQMTLIVAQLARLEMRMKQADPSQPSTSRRGV